MPFSVKEERRTIMQKNLYDKGTPLISVIVPVFNAEDFISETIQSVQAQTYTNWELILVDDKSDDSSQKIIKDYIKKDGRIKLLTNTENKGAAITRNNGIKAARGDFICFLDADDLWHKDKLKLQLEFMQDKDCAFSFTGYEFADANGEPNGKKVYIPATITYKQALKNTTITTIAVMFDMHKLTKDQIFMPDVQSEDTACWWKVLKKVEYAYGLNEILSYYRRGIRSHSSNKLEAAHQAWNLYRKVEKLNFAYALFCFVCYAFNAVRRRI